MATKHKHYDVIVAWAAGEEIEFRVIGDDIWRKHYKSYCTPAFDDSDIEFRIKPSNIVIRGVIELKPGECRFRPAEHWERENVEFTFDADTQKLVSVQIITH